MPWPFSAPNARALVPDPNRLGKSSPGPAVVAGAPDFLKDVKPILDHRCVGCHACNDAPCQLNLTAFEGLERGANKTTVYDSTRLREAQPTRLFIDEQSVAGWRALDFDPVLDNGLLVQMLALKRSHPLPGTMPLADSFSFGVDRKQQCPAAAQFGKFSQDYPLWGMPYGLPALTQEEERVLATWIAAGAPYHPPPPPSAAYAARVAEWEQFLNGDSAQEQLMSRYVYEHVFLADLYFGELDHRQFYRLVRSRTPPGQPVDLIASRRPYDDPGVTRVYYRLEPTHATIVAKTHLPYVLTPQRITRWRTLFLNPANVVTSLPSYDPEVASNPFIAFHDLPVESRYRFLLDDAGFFIMGFIKGPVCRGQVAVDVIQDRFWVFFADPDSPLIERSPDFLAEQSKELALPRPMGISPTGLIAWKRYASLHKRYLEARQTYQNDVVAQVGGPTLAWIWDGDGTNSNAGLTIFRNFDNAAVVRGQVGDLPKTAWVIGYSLFERIHYLLVAGFDVYGTMGHQLDTRLFMDFLRMEGEFNFIAMLPKAAREQVRDYWYEDADDSIKEYVYGSGLSLNAETRIPFRTAEPRTELMSMLRTRLQPVHDPAHDLDQDESEARRKSLQDLAALKGLPVSLLPEMSVIAVVNSPGAAAGKEVFTITRDNFMTNVASLFGEDKRRRPDKDALTVARGIIGTYPNAFFRVTVADLPAFVTAVGALGDEADYRALVARFGVQRTDPGFWNFSDQVLAAYATLEPVDAAILDFGRLENR